MNFIEKYKNQHKQILLTIDEMKKFMNHDQVISQNLEIRNRISKLAGIIKLHLATEDRFLYPELLKNKDENVRKTTQQFIDEMGCLYDNFSDYLERWPNGIVIKKEPENFISHSNDIFNALSNRIDKEVHRLKIR